jgi:hypothetical protein
VKGSGPADIAALVGPVGTLPRAPMQAFSPSTPTPAPTVPGADARQQGQPPQVAGWVFDAAAGHIHGVDEHGRVLMFVAASPLFGPRLAAAFSSAPAWAPTTVSLPRPAGPR